MKLLSHLNRRDNLKFFKSIRLYYWDQLWGVCNWTCFQSYILNSRWDAPGTPQTREYCAERGFARTDTCAIISDCKLQAETGKKEIEMKLEWDGTSEPEPGQDGNESLNYNRWLYGIKVSSVHKNWGEKDEQEDFFYLLSV